MSSTNKYKPDSIPSHDNNKSPSDYRPINESYDNERSNNYVRENSPAPTRADRGGDRTTNRK